MFAILLAWKNSLELLRPHRLATLAGSSVAILTKTSISFARSFLPFLLGNVVLFLLFGHYIAQVIADPVQYPPGFLFMLAIFAESITWFLTSTAFLLLLRREEPISDHHYYTAFILKYCQLTLAFMAAGFLIIALLMNANITVLPGLHWYCIVPLKALELLTIFFWLDAKPITFRNMLGAIEHGINFFFYNLPIIALVALLAIGIDYGISLLLEHLLATTVEHTLFANTSVLLAPLTQSFKGRCIVLCIKYGAFMIEIILATILLGIYRRKRHEQYSDSLFL